MRTVVLSCLMFVIGCSAKEDALTVPSNQIQFRSGIAYYKSEPFTGTAIEFYPNGKPQTQTAFENGREEGLMKNLYEDGSTEAMRYYHEGVKVGIHKGFWPGGAKKFEYPFDSGRYNGIYKEWYPDGKPAVEVLYKSGKETAGKGYRPNGKLYMNFTWIGNRRYGLMNPNMCYIVSGDSTK